MKKVLFSAMMVAACALSAGSAWADDAETKTGDLTITAQVRGSCSFRFDDSNIAFDIARDSLQADYTKLGRFTVSCGQGDDRKVQVSLDKGQNGADDGQRYLKQSDGEGTGMIGYQVFQGKDGKTPWDDKNNVWKGLEKGTYDFRVVLDNQGLSDKPVGTYKDTVQATLSYDTESPTI